MQTAVQNLPMVQTAVHHSTRASSSGCAHVCVNSHAQPPKTTPSHQRPHTATKTTPSHQKPHTATKNDAQPTKTTHGYQRLTHGHQRPHDALSITAPQPFSVHSHRRPCSAPSITVPRPFSAAYLTKDHPQPPKTKQPSALVDHCRYDVEALRGAIRTRRCPTVRCARQRRPVCARKCVGERACVCVCICLQPAE